MKYKNLCNQDRQKLGRDLLYPVASAISERTFRKAEELGEKVLESWNERLKTIPDALQPFLYKDSFRANPEKTIKYFTVPTSYYNRSNKTLPIKVYKQDHTIRIKGKVILNNNRKVSVLDIGLLKEIEEHNQMVENEIKECEELIGVFNKALLNSKTLNELEVHFPAITSMLSESERNEYKVIS